MFKLLFERNKYAPVFIIVFLVVAVSFITRIALLIAFGKTMGLSASFLPAFFIGFLYDLITGLCISVPFLIHITLTNNRIYTTKGKIITSTVFIVLLALVFFTNVFPRDYNKDLYKAFEIFISVRFAIYLFLCTRSMEFRYKWRSAILQGWIFLVTFILVFNAVSEFVFWQEFSGRYNFIAVDYLIYTNEVIGNIRESYPLPAIITAVFIAATLFFIPLRKYIAASVLSYRGLWQKAGTAVFILFITMALALFIPPSWVNFSSNNYANEFSGNGVYQFVQAFKHSELDYYKYYSTIPDETAFTNTRKELSKDGSEFTSTNLYDVARRIKSNLPERKLNVVLISVESLSASFMNHFGGTKNITPFLDSIAQHSLFFTQAYATGTRTVRGLEALSLSIPPSPGESIVKRKNNEQLFSLGSVFNDKGYITQFFYGGYSYFDNMQYFFSNNGYEVIDRNSISPADVHYSNIWGVADEDLFALTIQKLDENYKNERPFFAHVMTVSNHRPFTYPEGRIDIPSSSQSREGGVKYTDYAIGKFIKDAASKPWFANTVFVIVADHCAQSAGKTDLPVTGYHIPLIMYSPSIIPSRMFNGLLSQIDVAPTILGLLNFSYTSKFFGQNVLDSTSFTERAFISTYQGLGYVTKDKMTIQMPRKKVSTVQPDFTTGNSTLLQRDSLLENKAMSLYQSAAWLIKNRGYGRISPKK
ncbi:MAG: sulfatase-like hydrolase/transferase [Bacteroidetes bacterium]|nr:sulfatase-like hydrolase/transferase [Bacteroidota bacterium]